MKKAVFVLVLFYCCSLPGVSFAQSHWKKELLNYIQSKLHKADGAYGWEDQDDAHLTPTFAVCGILYNLDALPADRRQLLEFIRTHHPQKLPYYGASPSVSTLRNYTYEQIQAILWLGGDISFFNEEVKNWKSQAGILGNHEGHGYAGLFQETMTPICNKLLGLPMENSAAFLQYLENCHRPNGSFNNAPASTGGDGNILNTYWSLYAQKALSGSKTLTAETIAWLQACQLKNGGFTHQPDPKIGVNDDVIYTWAGIKALQMLAAKPKNERAVIGYLLSLRNADGGFGDRPGLHSTPVASYYAIDALKTLNALSALDQAPKPRVVAAPQPDFSGYKTYTVQFQAHGQGSPQEAVMLADSLKIQLWGVKYAVKGWVEAAQKIADEKKVPVTFFISDEPHDNLLTVPGMGSFDHILDYIAPAKTPVHFRDSATFDEFKNTTLKELKDVRGGLILQVSNNEPLARILIDESINNFGYLALSTVHFTQNFMVRLSYLAEYRYRLPLVSLQDAHGTESWWWSNELVNHRTLFIAKAPTYEGMITALKNNWIAAVRHDMVSNHKTNIYGGTTAARAFITKNQSKWQWWDNQENALRPWAAVTVLTPGDKFEAGHPDKGVAIRVRCWWNSTQQNLKSPAVGLEKLEMDGKAIEAKLVTLKARNGDTSDAYYLYLVDALPKGKHVVTATLRNATDGTVKIVSTAFDQN